MDIEPGELDLIKFYKNKLFELRYMQKLMTMDKQFTQEDLEGMEEIIKTVKKMLTRAVIEQQQKEKKEGRIK